MRLGRRQGAPNAGYREPHLRPHPLGPNSPLLQLNTWISELGIFPLSQPNKAQHHSSSFHLQKTNRRKRGNFNSLLLPVAVRLQAGRDAAARPAAARAATLVADVCGSPHDAAFFMRTLQQPASASANSVLPFAAARQSETEGLDEIGDVRCALESKQPRCASTDWIHLC